MTITFVNIKIMENAARTISSRIQPGNHLWLWKKKVRFGSAFEWACCLIPHTT